MPVTYVKLWKDGAWQKIESDRVERFIELGWSKDNEEKSLTKDKITVSAEVTSNVVEQVQEDDVCEECAEDPCVCEDDELPIDEEN